MRSSISVGVSQCLCVCVCTVDSFLIYPISNSLVSNSTHKTTTRTTRIGFRGFRTIHIRSPPKGGLLIGRVLKPLKPILVVLVVVLLVLVVVLWGEVETSELEMG